MNKYFLAVVLGLTLPVASHAGVTVAKIEKLLFVESGPGLVYIYPEGGVQNPPACHGSNGDYISYSVSRPMAKEFVSALMAAMISKKKVNFRTYGECVDQSVSDTLRWFTVYAD